MRSAVSLKNSKRHIYFDENNRNLIIANGENGPTSNHVWTIYNIDTNEETIIPIDFSEMGNDVPARSAFLEIKDDKYYLLFPSYLVEYDIQGKKSKTYNLKDLGIENAVLITAQWIREMIIIIHTKVI